MTQSHLFRTSVSPCQYLLRVAIAAAFAKILLSRLLAAQSRDQKAALCENSEPDVRINSSTTLILSGQETTENLAVDYYHRVAYKDESTSRVVSGAE